MNIQSWAENLTREVYEAWKNRYSDWDAGIKVFYSQPIEDPELVIIGYQPGGNYTHFKNEDEDKFAKGNFTISKNEFITTGYRMAKRMREFFGPEHIDVLEKSVIFPLVFFRAPRISTWRSWGNSKEAEMFCFLKIEEIIQKLKPKTILVLGLATYEKMSTFLKMNDEMFLYLETKEKGKRKVGATAITDRVRVFAMLHPTGARISNEHRKELKRLFFDWF
jgi:hypothetical protein